MQYSLDIGCATGAVGAAPGLGNSLDDFRARFKRALGGCMRRGFSVEECFGLIWEETLEKYEVPEEAYPALYSELIAWARKWVKCSETTTFQGRTFKGNP